MKKSRVLLALLLPVTALVLAFIFGIASVSRLADRIEFQKTPLPQSSGEAAIARVTDGETATQNAQSGFFVTITQGKISVYTAAQRQNPIKILDFDIRTLPPLDVDLLTDGLHFENITDLAAFLEDFSD